MEQGAEGGWGWWRGTEVFVTAQPALAAGDGPLPIAPSFGGESVRPEPHLPASAPASLSLVPCPRPSPPPPPPRVGPRGAVRPGWHPSRLWAWAWAPLRWRVGWGLAGPWVEMKGSSGVDRVRWLPGDDDTAGAMTLRTRDLERCPYWALPDKGCRCATPVQGGPGRPWAAMERVPGMGTWRLKPVGIWKAAASGNQTRDSGGVRESPGPAKRGYPVPLLRAPPYAHIAASPLFACRVAGGGIACGRAVKHGTRKQGRTQSNAPA